VVADATFFKRTFGIIVIRASHLRANLYCAPVINEKTEDYLRARVFLENKGFKFTAAVIDGKRGVKELFGDIPVQICHYHQKAIITRYLTMKPKLEASKELKEVVSSLCQSNEKEFVARLEDWHKKWADFLKEKSIDPAGGGWHFTHKRLRAAYRSLKTNLPNLFTYQRFPELEIPNTTNSLEGSFAHLKQLINVHCGMTRKLKLKIIREILGI